MRIAVVGATGRIGRLTVDTSSCEATDHDEVVEFFSRSTRNLLDAERQTGVQHHVVLTIVGLARFTGNAHSAGERAQEQLVERGLVPWSILPATQFHDFAEMVTTWTERDGSATIAPLLVQPVAPADVADVLAEIATGPPQGRCPDLAGPEPQDLVDIARRTRAARGTSVRLVPTWSGVFGLDMAGDVLLPGLGARIAPTSFDAWLAAETMSRPRAGPGE